MMWLWAGCIGSGWAGPFGAELTEHMDGHFASATDAAWYVALGDLEQVRRAANELDHDMPAVMPRSFKPYNRAMRSAARDVARAEDIPAAAQATARLAESCAGCHRGVQDGPVLSPEEARMQVLTPRGQHALAPYWLWVGLVMPSDDAWSNGASAMMGSPARAGSEPYAEAYEQLAQRTKTAAPGERAALWADIIGRCKACHDASGVAPEG